MGTEEAQQLTRLGLSSLRFGQDDFGWKEDSKMDPTLDEDNQHGFLTKTLHLRAISLEPSDRLHHTTIPRCIRRLVRDRRRLHR